MEIRPALLDDLIRDEGVKTQAYPDPLSPLAVACRRARLNIYAGAYRKLPKWPTLSGAPWTIGVGHTGPDVKEGLVWTLDKCRAVLEADAREHAELLLRYQPWVLNLDAVRQDALFNMVFNLGYNPDPSAPKKGLAGFKNSLGLIREGRYREAAVALTKSLWRAQTGDRAVRIIRMIEFGDRQHV